MPANGSRTWPRSWSARSRCVRHCCAGTAGATPGPVCYAGGGTEPTITDANVVLGYLNPGYLVGGGLRLDADLACAVFQEKVAQPLGLSLERAAYGAHAIAAANMIRAIRAVSIERGRDPRDYALFAFGGNGPVFACGMASAELSGGGTSGTLGSITATAVTSASRVRA